MSRAVTEWIAKHDDEAVPPRVRARIFLRENGICSISGRKIGPADQWDLEHRIALCNGGEHREFNLFPALRDKHREKTKEDVAIKSKIAKIQNRHLGLKPKRKWPKRIPYVSNTRDINQE